MGERMLSALHGGAAFGSCRPPAPFGAPLALGLALGPGGIVCWARAGVGQAGSSADALRETNEELVFGRLIAHGDGRCTQRRQGDPVS